LKPSGQKEKEKAKGRRGNKLAQIIKRGNTYTIRVSAGFDSKGKRIKKNLSWSPEPGMTAKQIEKELAHQSAMFEKKVTSGSVIDSKIKFADFATLWMKDYAEKQLAPKTIFEYGRLLPRIYEAIGHIRLDRLQPQYLMEFYNNLAEEGMKESQSFYSLPDLDKKISTLSKSTEAFARLSGISSRTIRGACKGMNVSAQSARAISAALGGPVTDYFNPDGVVQKLSGNTVKHYHRLISSILQMAVKWQVIESNPCSRVMAPKAERKESHYLDEEQAKHVIQLLENEPIKRQTMITLLIYSGMRRGEACGLQWSDIDFKNNLIHVRRAIIYIPGQGVFGTNTKTLSSVRTIKLSAIAFTLLKKYKKYQDEERLRLGISWQDTYREKAEAENKEYKPIEWLFTTWDGMPMNPDSITSWFHDFVKRNNLPPVSIHSLRHTNATLMIAGGANIRTVSNRLGHAQTSTTSNIYAHAIQSADAAAADTLENLLNPKALNHTGHKVDTN